MKSLHYHASELSEDKKITHIINLLDKAKSKQNESLSLKFIHSLRIDCIFLAYFGKSIPDELYSMKMEVFPETIDESVVPRSERVYFDGYKKARQFMLEDPQNTKLYDITDREFHQYRYETWKRTQETGGWKYVEGKKFKRRNIQ